jgi:hypothetical protein
MNKKIIEINKGEPINQPHCIFSDQSEKVVGASNSKSRVLAVNVSLKLD